METILKVELGMALGAVPYFIQLLAESQPPAGEERGGGCGYSQSTVVLFMLSESPQRSLAFACHWGFLVLDFNFF